MQLAIQLVTLAVIVAGFTLTLRRIKMADQDVTDLTAAVTALTTAVSGAVTEITNLTAELSTANANGDSDAVEALVAKINEQTAALTAATAPAPAPAA